MKRKFKHTQDSCIAVEDMCNKTIAHVYENENSDNNIFSV